LYFSLIPRLGLVGGAISSAIAYLLTAVVSELWFCKLYKVSVFNLFHIKKDIFSISTILKK
jgi:Na+-driven multidrug efflux pump